MSDQDPIQIPEADAARDALHAIRGYAYQLYATALEWARLAPEAQLFVERGSDYMAVAADALRGFEIKSTEGSGTVTLRNAGVVTLLSRFWRLANANPGRRVQMVYFTTSPPGIEQGAPFGSGAPGIDYWRLAATGADLTPLRAVLQGLPLDPGLAAWLADAPDEAVRDRLLRPIQFACGQPRLPEIVALAASAFVDLGAGLGLLPSDCEDAVPAAVLHLMRLAAQEGERVVTRGDLARILERTGTSRVSNAVLQQLQQDLAPAAALETGAIDVRDLPTEDLVVTRPAVLGALNDTVSRDGLAWLTGASGLGKTGLALQLAARRNGRWWVVEFDPRGASATFAAQLRRAQALILDPTFGGLILDDLPRGLDPKAVLALRRLALAARRADGVVVITAHNPPAPDLAEALCPGGEIVREAPYFTTEEVGQFIEAAGGDAAQWALPTWLHTAGYPKFVSARIADLRRRGWPVAESDPSNPTPGPDDLKLDQAALLDRLLRELPANAKTLLYRLSVPHLGFDRDLAMSLAAMEPAVEAPGEALNILVGPWVERRQAGRMRVSPLVAQAGAEALGDAGVMAVHAAVSRELSDRQPLQASCFDQLSLSAMIARHLPALRTVAGAIIQAERVHQAGLAHHLFTVVGLRLDKSVLPEDPDTALMLRTAQLKLAAHGGFPDHAVRVYRALVAEAAQLQDEARADVFRLNAVVTLLLLPDNPMPPAEWFAIIRGLRDTPRAIAQLAELEGAPVTRGDQDQLMFLWRTSHLRGVDDLEAVFGLLDGLSPWERRHYFEIFRPAPIGLRSLIQPAWVTNSRREDFSARETAGRYEALEAMAAGWEEADLAVECRCSRVVLLAEYAHDEAAALALLDEADELYSGHLRLQRERAKILVRTGGGAQAAQLLETVLAATPENDIVERYHVLRDIAVGVGRGGDLETAANRFAEAAATAERGAILKSAAAALHADLAVIHSMRGDPLAAGKSLFRAAELAELASPDELDHQFRMRGVLGAATWLWSGLSGYQTPSPAIGAISGPVSTDPLPGVAATPLLLWYQIRAIERALKSDLGAKARLDRHRAQGVSPYFEGVELRAELDAAIDAGDVEAFLPLMSLTCRNVAYKKATSADFESGAGQVIARPPWNDFALDLTESAQRHAATMAVVAMAMRLASLGLWDRFESLGQRLAADPALAEVAPLISPAGPAFEALQDGDRALAPALLIIFGTDTAPEPGLLLAATVRLWQWLRVSPFIDLIGAPVGAALADHWRRRAEEGAFALRNPRLHAPAILAAARMVTDGPGLARLIRAALPSVALQLPPEMEKALRQDAGQP